MTGGLSSSRAHIAAPLAVALTAFLVALPSIVNGFVYDDVFLIEQNAVVHRLSALGDLLRAPYWPEEHGSVMWRPVALIAFAVQWAAGGGKPLLFHVVNIVLYAVVSGLLAILVARLFGVRVGLLAGLLFAVHPVHVEVTANAVGQADLWAALGYLGALVAALARCRRDTGGRTVLLLLAIAAFAVALGGKEHVVTIPGALLVVWWLVARERGVPIRLIARREWPVLAAFIVLIGVYLFFRARFAVSITEAGGIATAFEHRSVLGRTVVMLPVSLQWLVLLFAPIRLSADYSVQHLIPQPTLGLTHVAAVLVWGALAVLVWRRRRQMPAIFAGFALFLVLMSVFSSLVVPLQVLMAERFLFLASLGWAVAIAGLVAAGSTAVYGRRVLLGFGIVVALFAARSAQRAAVWRDKETFYLQLLEDAPNSYRSHWAMGTYAFTRGDSVLGERELKVAIRLNPNRARLLEHLGRIYAVTDRYEPAIPLLERAMTLDSTRLPAALTLSLALARTGRPEKGLDVLETAANIHGEGPGLLVVRGEVLKRAGQPLAALESLDRMIELEPGLWRVQVMAAEAAALAGRCAEALRRLDSVSPAVPEASRGDVEGLKSWMANGNALCK